MWQWLAFCFIMVSGASFAITDMFNKETIPAPTCRLEMIGQTDEPMLMKTRQAVANAITSKCPILVVELFSPGGPVYSSVEISQELRRAKGRGIIVQTIGRSFVASGATLVLAAGSPGYREIARNALVLTHGVQVSNRPFSSSMICKDLIPDPQTEDDKFHNQIITQIATELSITTGKPLREVLPWFCCDNTQVGDGTLAIKLGLADRIVD